MFVVWLVGPGGSHGRAGVNGPIEGVCGCSFCEIIASMAVAMGREVIRGCARAGRQ